MMWLAESWILYGLGAGAAAFSLPALKARLELSRAKHPSLAGHSRLARRIAALVPGYAYDDRTIFCSDGAPPEVEARRRAGFTNLAGFFEKTFPKTLRLTAEARESLSDLQFTS